MSLQTQISQVDKVCLTLTHVSLEKDHVYLVHLNFLSAYNRPVIKYMINKYLSNGYIVFNFLGQEAGYLGSNPASTIN